MSERRLESYIDGGWRTPLTSRETLPVIDPATEDSVATVLLCGVDDVDLAVDAAQMRQNRQDDQAFLGLTHVFA